ncbi:glycosyltransferase family 2 protein [Vibrio splendidus]
MIIIPMAGMSSRFFNAGYKLPKYMLNADGLSLFEHSLMSFKSYFQSEKFLFIVKDIFNTPSFVREKAISMGIKDFHISILDNDTRGQAETVAFGIEDFESNCKEYKGSITIFNIDTFRPNFEFPDFISSCEGYLEVFRGEGDNWSFAKPENEVSNKVIETAEKEPISDLCSTGLYYFKSANVYLMAYKDYLNTPIDKWKNGEIYIAPLFNMLISKGLTIRYELIERSEVVFCGTPSEYLDFLKTR